MDHATVKKTSHQSAPKPGVTRSHSQSIQAILQPKLKIGQPNDHYEQEADRMAEKVVALPQPERLPVAGILSSRPQHKIVQRLCASCRQEQELIQPKSIPANKPRPTADLSAGFHALKSGGQPLTTSDRHFFEPRFGADFSAVRIHRDPRSAALAQSINSRAFTLGNNIVFAAGEYRPQTPSGRKLFAHELTHVLQQNDSEQMIRRYTAAEMATCPCLDWTLLRMFLTGRSMAAGGALTGRTYAMSFMDHFLNRRGSNRYVPFSDFNADSGGQSARDTVDGNIRNHFISQAQGRPCNGSATTSTSTSTPGHFAPSTDLFYAMGAFSLRAEASGNVSKQCDDDSSCSSIRAEYQTTYRVNDLYDWKTDPGGCTPATGESGCRANTKTVTLPVIGLICDECLNRLVIHGWADEFMVKVRGRGDFEIDSPCNVAAPDYRNSSYADNARNDP